MYLLPNRRTRQRSLLVAVLAIATAACTGESTGPEKTPTMSFEYSGAISGTFDAEGAFRRRDTLHEHVIALSSPNSVHGTRLNVIGMDAMAGGDWISFQVVTPPSVGRVSCAATADPDECGIIAAIGLYPRGQSPVVFAIGLEGTVEVESITAGWVRGSFSFVLPGDDTVRVRQGRFSAPIMTTEQYNAMPARSRLGHAALLPSSRAGAANRAPVQAGRTR